MAENSKIEWTDHTFNPWIGCTKVSPACDHCYAEAQDQRWRSGTTRWGPKAARTRTSEANWRKPLQWDRKAAAEGVRRKVFCASLADVFDNHASILPEWRADLWVLIASTPNLDWLLLTKRPQNITKMLPPGWGDGWPNVWLGTTVENQVEADRRIPHLLSVPARVHFISCEPLLERVSLRWLPVFPPPYTAMKPGGNTNHLDGLRKIGWVIAGGESGRGARPSHPDWFRDLRDQCAEAGVAFHFKQWGEYVPLKAGSGKWPTGALGDQCIRLDGDGEYRDNGWPMQRVGKTRAGRLLDGVQHDGVPI